MNDYVVCYTHLTGVFCLLEREKQHDWHACPHHPSPIDPRWEEEIVKCPNVVRIVHEGERVQADVIDWRDSHVKMASDGAEGYFPTAALRPVEQYVLIPCAHCGVPYLTLDPEQWHRDPGVCKKCWKDLKPKLIKDLTEALRDYSRKDER